MDNTYIIVIGYSREELVRHVNSAIRNGYRPCGTVTVENYSRVEYGVRDLWMQPMLHRDVQ